MDREFVPPGPGQIAIILSKDKRWMAITLNEDLLDDKELVYEAVRTLRKKLK
jgi:hypothetical protein